MATSVQKLDSELLAILACPRCQQRVTLTDDGRGLVCQACHIAYPIRNGVPVMLPEESVPLRGGEHTSEIDLFSESAEKAVFGVVEGKNKGEKVELVKGTCRAIGRSLDDMERTRVLAVDASIHLDDTHKKLVTQYLARQFQKSPAAPKSVEGQETIGNFIRGPDFQLQDGIVSRLHAMLFYDGSGTVGILDLVSRNGTYVNGAEVESKTLKKGDLITIGSTKIRYEA